MAINSAWGIDIGNRALKAIKLVREGDGVRVDDFEVIEHEHVLSNAGDNREELIRSSIAHLVERHQFKNSVIGVGVSGQSSFARFIKLPPVESKKIPEIVRFEAIQQIPFPLDDVEWSYQLFESADSPEVEVGIFAMRKELINQHIKYFTDAQLNVQVVQMNPLAVYNAMYYDSRIKGTTMIVDLGAENTDLIIADTETVWLRSIPIGGNNFTEALVKSFKLNFVKAEDLKRNAAASKYARQIFQAMRPVFADLVAEIQRSIGFYASVHRDSRIKKIEALGGTFKLPGLQKYLQQNLQLEVARMDALGAGVPADPKMAGTFNDNILSLVSAYGLALQAMGEGKISSSLLPSHIRREKMWQEKTKWFAAAAALFVLGTGVGFGSWFVNKMAYDNAQAERGQISTIEAQAANFDSSWSDIESSGTADRQRIKNVRSLTSYRDVWPNLLADIYQSVPAGDEAAKPRGQRELVWIESINSEYKADLAPVLAAKDLKEFSGEGPGPSIPSAPMETPDTFLNNPFGGRGGRPGFPGIDPLASDPFSGGYGYGGYGQTDTSAAGGAAGTTRGFIITIRGMTPFTDAASFIDRSLVKALQAIDDSRLTADRPYVVVKAEIVSAGRLADNTNRLGQLKQLYDAAVTAMKPPDPPSGPAAFRRRLPGDLDPLALGGAQPNQPQEERAWLDRVTGEDIRQDWEFTVVAVVQLDPPPKAADATDADATAAAQ